MADLARVCCNEARPAGGPLDTADQSLKSLPAAHVGRFSVCSPEQGGDGLQPHIEGLYDRGDKGPQGALESSVAQPGSGPALPSAGKHYTAAALPKPRAKAWTPAQPAVLDIVCSNQSQFVRVQNNSFN